MNPADFLLMRHELLLIAAAVGILIADLAYGEQAKKKFLSASLVILSVVVALGFLPAPTGELFGGMYLVDPLKLIMKNILNLAAILILFQAYGWLTSGDQLARSGEYLLLIVSVLIGMNYMISSGHLLMFYLSLELSTIPLAALAAFDSFKSHSAEAGIKFILLAAFSSAILLFGTSLIYPEAGSLYFAALASTSFASVLSLVGLAFFLAGLAFKISLVPFHLWTADVYEGSPVNVTTFLSVVSKGASVFILMILLFTVFRDLETYWDPLLYVLAVLTMTLGNLFALRQKNLKRFLAFSSVAQAGFIILGVIGHSPLGLSSVIYFVFVYLFSNVAAFGVVMAVEVRTGKGLISDLDGFYQTNPALSLIMMLALFSLAGIPPVAGFFGKFFLFAAAAEKGYFILVVIGVVNATIALYYYLMVVKAMFINSNEQPLKKIHPGVPLGVSLLVCTVGILVIGFFGPVFDRLMEISASFFA